MKIRNLIVLLLLVLSASAQSQKLRTLYYTDQWELTTKDLATYYRICIIDSLRSRLFLGEVKDYTVNGKLLMTGRYGVKKVGQFTFYYSDGQIESQGEFINDKRAGVWDYFYPNGKPFRQVTFDENSFLEENFFVNYLYDTNGAFLIKDGTGVWTNEYEWYGVDGADQKFIVKGNFLNGKKVGEWECRFSNGDYVYKETFSRKGQFKEGYFTNPDGSKKESTVEEFQNKFLPHFKHQVTESFLSANGITQLDYPFLSFLQRHPSQIAKTDSMAEQNKVFLVIESPPEYIGGVGALAKFINANLKYPYQAKRMQIEGSVFVQFIIEKDGSVTEPSVLKGLSKECDNEAVRLISLMPKWKPGMQSGKAVRVRFVYPVRFRLD